MNFKKWLEHDHLYDDLDKDFRLGSPNPKAQERLDASGVFLGKSKSVPNPNYDPNMPVDPQSMFAYPPKEYQDQNPDWKSRWEDSRTEDIPPEIDLKNKIIVLSKYRHPPVVTPIGNQDVSKDSEHGRKPRGGLWYSFGNKWIETAQGMPHRLRMFIHEIKIDPNKILVLDTKEKTKLFEKDYGVKREMPGLGRYEILINWPNVVRDYSGIEIKKSGLHFIDYQEYWDLDSGCLWNQDALKDSRLLYVYDVHRKKYVKPRELGIYSGRSSRITRPLPPSE